MSDVARLLQQSWAAHQRYYQHHQVWDPTTKQWAHGSLPDARLALEEARRTRLDAHALDPDHTDPAWRDDKAPHADVLAFYDGRLASTDV